MNNLSDNSPFEVPKSPLRIVFMWSHLDCLGSPFRQTLAVRGSALARERTIGTTSYLCATVLHIFLKMETDAYGARCVEGNARRLGWPVLAASADLLISRNVPIRVADVSP